MPLMRCSYEGEVGPRRWRRRDEGWQVPESGRVRTARRQDQVAGPGQLLQLHPSEADHMCPQLRRPLGHAPHLLRRRRQPLGQLRRR